jgi:hypothetical protein
MNLVDTAELAALKDHRQGCRIAWIGALSHLATGGQRYPTVEQYERLENLLRSLKLAQRRIDDFELGQPGPVDVATPSSELDALRSGYVVAHNAYRECARRMKSQRNRGHTPTASEVAAESAALHTLGSARRTLMIALGARGLNQ